MPTRGPVTKRETQKMKAMEKLLQREGSSASRQQQAYTRRASMTIQNQLNKLRDNKKSSQYQGLNQESDRFASQVGGDLLADTSLYGPGAHRRAS